MPPKTMLLVFFLTNPSIQLSSKSYTSSLEVGKKKKSQKKNKYFAISDAFKKTIIY